jgi:hypothetical protein
VFTNCSDSIHLVHGKGSFLLAYPGVAALRVLPGKPSWSAGRGQPTIVKMHIEVLSEENYGLHLSEI